MGLMMGFVMGFRRDLWWIYDGFRMGLWLIIIGVYGGVYDGIFDGFMMDLWSGLGSIYDGFMTGFGPRPLSGKPGSTNARVIFSCSNSFPDFWHITRW